MANRGCAAARQGFVAGMTAIMMLAAPYAHAEYPEKNIEFIIPFEYGGGFDRTVREIAPILEMTLPHKVGVFPRNVPGKVGRTGMATVFRARPDGYTIGIADIPGAAIPQLMGEHTEYDIDKFTWLARLSTDEYLFAVAAKSSVRSLDDLRKFGRPVQLTTTGFGTTVDAAGQIFGEVMKFPMQDIAGYKGTPDAIIAVLRGDGDAVVAPVSILGEFIRSGELRAIFTTERKSSINGVPTVADLGFAEISGLAVERHVIGPPNIPEPIAKMLSDALVKAAESPDAKAFAAKVNEPFAPLAAADGKASADRALALYARYKGAINRKN
jgi:tripartite-type tricarboxylate transporter receptor subunit TctC